MEKKQLVDVINTAITTALANTHTVVVAKVTMVNEKTINCKPVINRLVDGEEIELPEFIEVPPIFMQGGGSYIAHPIAVDDYCLLLISERCFDRWYNGEDFKRPLELRMHDYSDAFALVGINPLAAAIPIPTVTQMEGDVNKNGDHTHIGNYDIDGNMTVVGDLHVDGNITCTGNISAEGDVVADSAATAISLLNHVHTGNLGAPTSPPTP